MSTTQKTLIDGRTVSVPTDVSDRFRGVDADGDLLVETDFGEGRNFLYPLTPCCQASGKGSFSDIPIVVCRSCYSEVSSKFGGVFGADDIFAEAA